MALSKAYIRISFLRYIFSIISLFLANKISHYDSMVYFCINIFTCSENRIMCRSFNKKKTKQGGILHYHLLTTEVYGMESEEFILQQLVLTVHLEQTSIHIINVLSECQLDMQAFIYLFCFHSSITMFIYQGKPLYGWLYLFGIPESEECCHEEIRVN